jgi:hypothetical protein
MAYRRRSAAAVALVLAGCAPGDPPTAPGPRMADLVIAGTLIGDWTWQHATDEDGVRRVERERWHLAPTGDPRTPIAGWYLREVDVASKDGTPFGCNQRAHYAQRARYDVRAVVAGGVAVIQETGYHAEPSPCDHGFRRLGHSLARVRRHRLHLRWEVVDHRPGKPEAAVSGLQTLDRAPATSAPPPWPPPAPGWNGPWQWSVRTIDESGRIRDEVERWEIAVGAAGAGATYRREVTIHTAGGAPAACAGGKAAWTYVDSVVLEGKRDGDLVALREIAIDAGQHPCLEPAPRALDAVTLQLDGAYLEATWRGKRRQILHRGDRAAGGPLP